MKVDVRIDHGIPYPYVVIHTSSMTEEVNEAIKSLTANFAKHIIGYDHEKLTPLEPGKIIRFFTENKRVQAQTMKHVYEIRERLYQLENLLNPSNFIRISNSEIVNIHMIQDLELTFNGTYKINLRDGISTFTSRRYVNHLKRRLEL